MSKELTIVEVLAKHVKMEPKTLWGEITIWSKDAVKAMQEYSYQNTKPLIDEIAELRKTGLEAIKIAEDLSYLKKKYESRVEELQVELAKLKASKSEANETKLKSEDEWLELINNLTALDELKKSE